MGLTHCANAPCLFRGQIIPNAPLIYIGLYVDDFLYFSESTELEQAFKQWLKEEQNMFVDFDKDPVFFLGMRIDQIVEKDDLSIFLSQEARIDALLEEFNLITANPVPPPYCAGYLVDKIFNTTHHPQKVLEEACHTLHIIIGSLNWLYVGARIDIATITSMLVQYLHNATPPHVVAAKYVLKHLKGNKNFGPSIENVVKQ
eukprot:10184730-Ditylum_brightwellii.AAC.1